VLMRKVEARRLRIGTRKTELAARLGTTTDAVRAWLTGRTIGRKEMVTKIKRFLECDKPNN
jgi:DNA-binding transcriptional regulator YiaG